MGRTAFWVHHGRSLYARGPVIRYRFAAEPAADLSSVTADLTALLPGFHERHALCASTLETESNGSTETSVHHFFEHLGIELQNLVGAELGCLRSSARISGDQALVPFEDERVGLEAGALALEVIDSLASGHVPPDWQRRLRSFVRFAERDRMPAQDAAILRAATARDIPVLRIAGRLVQLGQGRHQQRLSGTKTSHTTMVGNDLASNKDYARRLLKTFGLPVPAYERVHRREDAVTVARRIGFPVVVKPNESKMGGGVRVGMKSPREVREAFDHARTFGNSVLVEQFVEGSDFRMLVIDGRLVAAARRVAAHVVGDGVTTITELVRRANLDPRRGERQQGSWTRLEFDDVSDLLLAERRYHRNSIARDGEVVFLRRVANTSAGGTAIDVTDRVHPENREIAERAAIAIGLDVAGVDLLVHDITQPMRAQGGVICEINSRPGLRKHLWPAEGRPRDVIGPILDMLFPPGSRSRIPIAVVTGTGDTRGVARLLVDRLAADGTIVGLAAPDGAFVGGRRRSGSDVAGAAATRMLLLDPTVEMLVVEAALDDVCSSGIDHDRADVCAIVNDRPIRSGDLLEPLGLVAGTARSHVIMTAADEAAHDWKLQPSAAITHVDAREGGPAAWAVALAQCLGRESTEVDRALAESGWTDA